MKRKKLNSQEKLKKARKKVRTTFGIRNRKFVALICNSCKREYKIRVNNIEIYTDEVREKWVCLNCDKK